MELLIERVIVRDQEVEIRYVIPTDSSSEQVRFCHSDDGPVRVPFIRRANGKQFFVDCVC